MPAARGRQEPTPPAPLPEGKGVTDCVTSSDSPNAPEFRRSFSPFLPREGGRGVRFFFLLALALLTSTIALSAQPPVDPLKRPEPPKVEAKDAKPLVVKLPDGTYLWLGPADGGE